MEELEETPKIAILTRGLDPKLFTDAEIGGLVRKFNVDWDD